MLDLLSLSLSLSECVAVAVSVALSSSLFVVVCRCHRRRCCCRVRLRLRLPLLLLLMLLLPVCCCLFFPCLAGCLASRPVWYSFLRETRRSTLSILQNTYNAYARHGPKKCLDIGSPMAWTASTCPLGPSPYRLCANGAAFCVRDATTSVP